MNILDQYDSSRYTLGVICKRSHDFLGTGKSLRRKSGACIQCGWEYDRAKVENQFSRFDPRSFEQRILACTPHQLDFDHSKFKLGLICRRGHDWIETGLTLRRIKDGSGRGDDCIKCASQRVKQFYIDNPGIQRLYKRNYYDLHPEKMEEKKARDAAWVRANREKCREGCRRWRKRNPETVREGKKRYARLHPDSNRIQVSRRRARKQNAHKAPYSEVQLMQRAKEFGDRCAYCTVNPKEQWDHFISLSRGGSDNLGNLVPACGSCNASKNCSDPCDWYKRQPSYKRSRWLKILKVLGKTEQNYNQIPLL